jgi:hypothetical protein
MGRPGQRFVPVRCALASQDFAGKSPCPFAQQPSSASPTRGAIADGYFGAGQSSVGKTNGTSGWPTGPAPGSARGATLSALPGVAKREAAT